MLQNWLSVISTSCATIAAMTAVLALRTSNKQLKANADQYQANYEQDRSDRRRRQAERVTAWVDETHDLQILSNQSGMPVYDAVLTFVIKDRDARESAVNADPDFRHACRTLPPGDWQFPFPGGWGEAGAHPGVELAFRDTAGHNWLRTSRGELKELGMSPIEYYDDMCYPYGSDILVRYEF